MHTVHVPMSTYCTAQRQHTQSTARAPECDISSTSHVYAGASWDFACDE